MRENCANNTTTRSMRWNGGRALPLLAPVSRDTGYNQPPDATFTLRLSYGAVKGYQEKGKQIPYSTDFAGGFKHSAEHANNRLTSSRKLDEGQVETDS